MKDTSKYYQQQEVLVLEKTKEILSRLPDYCGKVLFAKELSANSKYAYAQDLEQFFHFLSVEQEQCRGKEPIKITQQDLALLTISDLDEYSIFLKQNGYTANTRSRRLSAVRTLFAYLYRTGKIKEDPSTKIEMPTSKARAEGHEIRFLTAAQAKELLIRVKTNTVFEGKRQKRAAKWTVRNYAIIALFLHTGMRLSELAGIDVNDLDLKEQKVYIHRKGGKKSDLYMNKECTEAVSAWLMQRKQLTVEEGEKALFISERGRRLSSRMIEQMISDSMKACGFPVTNVHALRRSYGTQFYDQTGDIYLLADNLGHSSVDVTAKHYAKMLSSKRKKNKEIDLYAGE